MSSATTDPKYSYLEEKALKDLEQSTKQILLNKKIGFTSLLKLDEAKLEKLGIDYGDVLLLLDFIEQNKSSSPNNTTSNTSTAVKDANIGGALLSGVTAQNIDAHNETHITNIIQVIQQEETSHASANNAVVAVEDTLSNINKKNQLDKTEKSTSSEACEQSSLQKQQATTTTASKEAKEEVPDPAITQEEGGESLDVYCNVDITDEQLIQKVQRCKNLIKLDVRYTQKITDKSIIWIAQHCKNLVMINVGTTNGRVTDASVVEVAKNCSKLERLYVAYSEGITDTSILEIAAHCRNLAKINVVHTSGRITDASLNKIRESNPNCQILGAS